MPERPLHASIIVPTYNERDNLAPLVTRLAPILPPQSEILIVDDNSPDGTAAEAERLARDYPVRCVVRTTERGLATAVTHGMRVARGKVWVVMDADLSHPPEVVPQLIGALADQSVKMAIGSRFVPGGRVDLHWPLHRRLNSLAGRLLARPLTGVRDMMSGFFCVRGDEVDIERLDPVGYKIALEIIVRHRWKNIVEIPITFMDRAAGQTKLTMMEETRFLRHLWRLYSFKLFGSRAK
ncbi:MAG: polyprenol monophosphomannose synthase [Phycisphaerales bacterium]|nr:polyprenol monophosphomannose synthase [Phycisphaerales bacterium]